MYKLFHWLFGWDYICFEYGFSTEIRKIQKSSLGREYVRAWGSIFFLTDNYLADLNGNKRPYIHLTRPK